LRLVKLTGGPDVRVEHRDESIVLNVSFTDKIFTPTFNWDSFDQFKEFNLYVEQLPGADQDRLFSIYKRIEELFFETNDLYTLNEELSRAIAQMYEVLRIDDILHWVKLKAPINFPVPAVVPVTFVVDPSSTKTRERTYTLEDYQNLVSLCVASKAVMPIFGHYISVNGRALGTTWKENDAFKLLARSSLEHSKAMERLREFIVHVIPNDKSIDAAVMKGVSEEDFPEWVLGMLFVRRVAVADIRAIDPTSAALVAFVHNYIGQVVKNNDNRFGGPISTRDPDRGNQNSEDSNTSKMEDYKGHYEYAAGELLPIEYFSRNVEAMAKRINPELDRALLKMAMDSVRPLENLPIMEVQITLARNMMGAAIVPEAVDHWEKTSIVRLMGVALAALWQAGHYEIAGLMTAVAQPRDVLGYSSSTESRSRITKPQQERIQQLWPYERRASARQNRSVKGKEINSALTLIEKIDRELREFDWKLTLPPDWVSALTSNPKNRLYSVPYDIKIKLANFAIAIAEGVFHHERKSI
jgi:hypothetical protein